MPNRTLKEKAVNLAEIIGRQLPYSIENEAALLGAMIIDSDRIGEVSSIVKAEDFYIEKNKEIYSALLELSVSGKGIDVVTLIDKLVKKGVYTQETGTSYIKELAENVPATTNILDYAEVVHDKAILRKLIAGCERIIKDSYDQADETRDIIDRAEAQIFDIANGNIKSDFSPISEIIKQCYSELNEKAKHNENTASVKTYFGDIDSKLVSLDPGNFILIGARPGVGKTSFAMNIATEVAKHRKDKAVAVFSLEMTKTEIVSRMLTSEAKIDGKHMKEGNLNDDEYSRLAQAATALSETNIYIDDSSNITTVEMASKLRRIKNLGLVIIDYLQLMHSHDKQENRVLEVSNITRNLKILAKTLNCPIIACSQLARISQDRKEKKPQLTDLRESGSIEQDADMVLFLHRDSYYESAEASAQDNTTLCIIAKNRHGSQGEIKLGWSPQFTRFSTIEQKYDYTEEPQ